MFIELHRRKDGEAFLLNAGLIEYIAGGSDGAKIYMESDTSDSYMVKETLADLALMLEPRRLNAKTPRQVTLKGGKVMLRGD